MENIKNIIPTVIEQMGQQKAGDQEKIFRVWARVVDEKMVKHCAIEGVKDHTLSVNVDSSAWLFQFNCQKGKLLQMIKEEIPELKRLIFKIGNIK